MWSVGEWSSCRNPSTSAALQCGYGVRERVVECRLANSLAREAGVGVVLSDEVCTAAALALSDSPARQERCDADPCRCTTTSDCSSLGDRYICGSQGTCVCSSGWGGANCSVILLQPIGGSCSPTAVIDISGFCCDAAAIDVFTGACCSGGASTDALGRCCNTFVDACGVCGGNGVIVDVTGMCCSQALAPSGLCCNLPIDSCGVCGGTNNCDAVVTMTLPMDANMTSFATAIGIPPSSIANFTVLPSSAGMSVCH